MAYRLVVVPGDSEDLRALLQQLGTDIEVQVFENANDALWEVRNSPPEVVLANVQLPGMSGMDLAEILPNFGVPTKVVLWSGTPNQEAARQSAEFGVHRFVNGALPLSDLRQLVRQALRDAEEAAKVAEAQPEPEPEPPPPPPPPPPERPRRMHDVPAAPPLTERARRLHDVAPAPPPPERARRMHDVAPAPPPLERARRDRPERAENPPVAHVPEAPKPTTRPRGALVLTVDNLKPIRSRMEALEREVGSLCIILADRAGMVLAEVGSTTGMPMMILLPLLSTSFSTAGQITQMLRETESSALYMHEGSRYDMYCFDVLQRFMLVITFDNNAPGAKIGSVWVYAKRAIRDIQELLA